MDKPKDKPQAELHKPKYLEEPPVGVTVPCHGAEVRKKRQQQLDERAARDGKLAYKSAVDTMDPVAIKLGQHEVHAPEHDNWGEVIKCDQCKDQFRLGKHRIYGTNMREEECTDALKKTLAADHRNNRPHANRIEF